jgi:predicted RNase H-like nuclease (RuvC/YqgF family)
MKIAQENERMKDYVRKMKEENKNYKAQMEELVQALSSRLKKYKLQFEEKVQSYEAKIKHLESKLKANNSVGEDLDRELEELAKLEAVD